MAEFNHPELGVRFTLPDDPTVLQLLNYDEFEVKPYQSMYVRLWEAAKTVIQDWECETVGLDVSLGEVASQKAIEIIKWAARAVMSWRFELKSEDILLPKN